MYDSTVSCAIVVFVRSKIETDFSVDFLVFGVAE